MVPLRGAPASNLRNMYIFYGKRKSRVKKKLFGLKYQYKNSQVTNIVSGNGWFEEVGDKKSRVAVFALITFEYRFQAHGIYSEWMNDHIIHSVTAEDGKLRDFMVDYMEERDVRLVYDAKEVTSEEVDYYDMPDWLRVMHLVNAEKSMTR